MRDYERLRSQALASSAIPVLSPAGGQVEVLGTAVISDSIILWCKDSWEAIQSLLAGCSHLIATAVDSEIPLRGGVAYGRCVLDRATQTFVGRPLVDAYVTEQSQNWVGAALHRSVTDHPLYGASIANVDDVIRYAVPRKQCTPPLEYAIHWCPYSLRGAAALRTLIAQATDRRARRKLSATQKYVFTDCVGYHSASESNS